MIQRTKNKLPPQRLPDGRLRKDPDSATIAERCLEIQATWSADERAKRCCYRMMEQYQRGMYRLGPGWSVPEEKISTEDDARPDD